MAKQIVGLALAIGIATSVATVTANEESVAGAWTMTVDGMTFAMELVQHGQTITGTLETPHGPLHLTGEFVAGRLTMSGATDGRDHPLEITGTGVLRPDGTLAGDLKSNVGDMSWTAVREQH